MKVTLIGMGCGPETLTLQAKGALEDAELLVGARRLLEALPDCQAMKVPEYRSGEIMKILKDSGVQRCSVLLSGDSGFYSGAAGLLSLLTEEGLDAEVLPGISSLQALAAKLGRPWQDWRICSAHGADCDPVWAVMQGTPSFFLTAGASGPANLCRSLTDAGLGTLEVTTGENLGSAGEKICTGTAEAFAQREFAPLNVLLAEAAPRYPRRTSGIPDGEFLREQVPMTKQEVRAAILAKLAVDPEDVCWDVGAGTGSVSVELALHARSVWAVEQKPEAAELARKNREKFCAWNLHIVEGQAPEALAGLPGPDAVFVGGSGGRLAEILGAVEAANPRARICVSAITLETLHEAVWKLDALGWEAEVAQISVSRTKAAGNSHLLMSQNPVFLITGVRP